MRHSNDEVYKLTSTGLSCSVSSVSSSVDFLSDIVMFFGVDFASLWCIVLENLGIERRKACFKYDFGGLPFVEGSRRMNEISI